MKYITIINPANGELHFRRNTMDELVDDYDMRLNVMTGMS